MESRSRPSLALLWRFEMFFACKRSSLSERIHHELIINLTHPRSVESLRSSGDGQLLVGISLVRFHHKFALHASKEPGEDKRMRIVSIAKRLMAKLTSRAMTQSESVRSQASAFRQLHSPRRIRIRFVLKPTEATESFSERDDFPVDSSKPSKLIIETRRDERLWDQR